MIIDSLTEIRTYRENADDMCDSRCLTVVKNEKKIVLPLTSLYNLLPLLVSTTLFLAEKKIPQIGQPKQCPNKIYLLAVFMSVVEPASQPASQPTVARLDLLAIASLCAVIVLLTRTRTRERRRLNALLWVDLFHSIVSVRSCYAHHFPTLRGPS